MKYMLDRLKTGKQTEWAGNNGSMGTFMKAPSKMTFSTAMGDISGTVGTTTSATSEMGKEKARERLSLQVEPISRGNSKIT